MKAITICQPYASLIVNPPHQKRVENRTWPTAYRGPIAIHAGKSRNWLKEWPGPQPNPMPFGAIVGVAKLVNCVRFNMGGAIHGLTDDQTRELRADIFATGPFCWLFDEIRPLSKPIPMAGLMGLFDLSPDVAQQVFENAVCFAEAE